MDIQNNYKTMYFEVNNKNVIKALIHDNFVIS